MTASLPGRPATRRQWVRARSRATGKPVALVVVRIDQPELIVLEPLTALLRVSPDEAVAVAVCLRVAAHGLSNLDTDDLVIEADSGSGWQPVIPDPDQ
jgi:hypothetical protein